MPLEGLQENLRLGEGLPLTLYEADYDVKGMVRAIPEVQEVGCLLSSVNLRECPWLMRCAFCVPDR